MISETPGQESQPTAELPHREEVPFAESPEEESLRMQKEAGVAVDSFRAECDADTGRVTAQAAEVGVAIDAEDISALQALPVDADAAKQQLLGELEKKEALYQLPVTLHAQTVIELSDHAVERAKESIAKLEVEIGELDRQLAESKNSFLGRILNFRSNKRIERLKASRQWNIGFEQRHISERETEKVKYEAILEAEAERERLAQEELKLREDAERQRIALEQSEREARNVKNLMAQYGCYFVHNIVDDAQVLKSNAAMANGGSFNPMLEGKELDWSDRIDIVYGLEPTLSVSTISKPDQATYRDDKSTFTLLLKGGRVLAGSPGELWTVANGLKQRTFTEESSKLESIGKAIDGRGDIGYNELVVADPEVAGVAFAWPTKSIPEEFTPEYVSGLKGWDNELVDKYQKLWEKMPKLLEKKVDIFIMVNNQPRVLYDIDVPSRSFKVAPVPDMPRNIAYRPGMGDYERKNAMNRVIDRVL